MISLDPAGAARRRKGYQRRGVVASAAAMLMILSMVLPHVMVRGADEFGRTLIPAGAFFFRAQAGAEAFATATDLQQVALGLNVTYFGLGCQQIALMIALFTFWMLYAEDVGRWIRRFAMFAGWLMIISAALVVTGRNALDSAGIPTELGLAWLPTLAAGLILVVGGIVAKRRLDSTWYMATPELM